MQMAEVACKMLPAWVHIYTPSALQLEGPHLSLTIAILAKGKVFFRTFGLSLRSCRSLNSLLQQINTARGYCWGPSSSEGPQKHDLTMFPKCNMCTGTFGLGMKQHTI
jgi:hypothetical protein